jgi:hypothetical protein
MTSYVPPFGMYAAFQGIRMGQCGGCMGGGGRAILAVLIPGRDARAQSAGRENDEGCNDFHFPLSHQGGRLASEKDTDDPGAGSRPWAAAADSALLSMGLAAGADACLAVSAIPRCGTFLPGFKAVGPKR